MATSAVVIACNALLGNEPGHFVEADAAAPPEDAESLEDGVANQPDAGDAASESGDADAGLEGGLEDAAWAVGGLSAHLAVWLDGDFGITSTLCDGGSCVLRWADQSGTGNDAIAASVSSAPLRSSNSYHGHAALRFDGNKTTLAIADNRSLEFTGGASIVGVVATDPSTHEGGIYGKSVNPPPFYGIGLWVNYRNNNLVPDDDGRVGAQVSFLHAAWTDGGYADSVLRVYAATFDGTTLSLRLNQDIQVSALASDPIAARGVDAYVGGRPAANQVFAGDIAEVIVFDKGLSDAEYGVTYGYLRAKYGL
jgi:hypothetical protein